ncbi:MAG: aldose 1-epimerase [Bacteroidota bacterium]|jgi:aldose 1-epimerase
MRSPVQFSIRQETLSGLDVITVKNNLTHEYFSVLPSSGARLRELNLSNGSIALPVLRTIMDPRSKNREDIFTNAKLSPFAGRVKEGRYSIGNTSYQLPLNYPEEENACHGFVYDKQFTVVRSEVLNDRAVCFLNYDYQGELAGYPFRYSLEIIYMLGISGEFICETRIVNRSGSPIPVSDGWHPYFDIDEPVDDLQLSLEVDSMMELNGKNIPTGKMDSYSKFSRPETLYSQHFDSCFHVKGSNGIASTRIISSRNDTALTIWQETGPKKYNYLVLYTPLDRRSIAIEPMTSNVNAFNNGEGLIMLEPGEDLRLRFGITMTSNSSHHH